MTEIPEHYGDDRLVALVRDPSNIFVYWDLENGGRAALETELGAEEVSHGRWMLRVTNLDTSAISDIAIQLDARNWYASVIPGCSYDVALGFVDRTGTFHKLLSQGPVRMPPLSYSHIYDKQWMILEEDYLRLLALGWSGFIGSSATSNTSPGTSEAAWVTVVHESQPTESTPTSPGVPVYKGRK